jgi:hypothetical protein
MYEKPVRILMQEMIPAMGIKQGDVFSRNQAVRWFAENYPKLKQGTVAAHLIRLSTNVKTRLQYSAKADGSDDHFFKIDSSNFRLYQSGVDPTPISEKFPDDEEPRGEEVEGTGEFAYEHDLRDFLARNLQLIESGLSLYRDEDITGVEYPVGGRFIDLLATDADGNYVVIELKVSKGYDRVVGQLLRYVNWIKLNLAENDEKVRGIIIAKNISNDLILACSELFHISLMEYELAVKLKSISGVTP